MVSYRELWTPTNFGPVLYNRLNCCRGVEINQIALFNQRNGVYMRSPYATKLFLVSVLKSQRTKLRRS